MRMKSGMAVALAIVVASTGCHDRKVRRQYESVAKDWSLMIRASQIIPIYPLSQDLRPGDLFIVETPIQQTEREYYRKSGFLRLDQHVGRLHKLGFGGFYDFPAKDASSNPNKPWFPAPGGGDDAGSWEPAPMAAFPTFSFSVKSGAGLNLAVPVQGVPVGLALMKTAEANGSLAIRNAHTFGVSLEELSPHLREWLLKSTPDSADPRSNRERLSAMRAAAKNRVYLRVINRIFVAQSFRISMTNTSAGSGGLDAGMSPEAALLEKAKTADGYSDALETVNKAITTASGSGSVRVVQATNRNVSLDEDFDQPLVVGFLAFDYEVLEGGELGPPLATRDALAGVERVGPGILTPVQEATVVMVAAIGTRTPAEQKSIYDDAAKRLGNTFEKAYAAKLPSAGTPELAFSQTKMDPAMRDPVGPSYYQRIHDALRAAWNKVVNKHD